MLLYQAHIDRVANDDITVFQRLLRALGHILMGAHCDAAVPGVQAAIVAAAADEDLPFQQPIIQSRHAGKHQEVRVSRQDRDSERAQLPQQVLLLLGYDFSGPFHKCRAVQRRFPGRLGRGGHIPGLDKTAHLLHHGAGKSCQDQHGGSYAHAVAQKPDQRQRNRQLCARGNTQYEGPGNGVGEKRLQQKTGYRQRAAQKDCRQNARQTDIPDDGGALAGLMEQNAENLPDGQVNTAGIQVPHEQDAQQEHQAGEGESVPADFMSTYSPITRGKSPHFH